MDINKFNQQTCNLKNCGNKVNDISTVDKKHTCLVWFLVWNVCIRFSKKFNHNQGAKDKTLFECHEEKEDDGKYLNFNFDDENNNNQEQSFLKNKADITDYKFIKGSKQYFQNEIDHEFGGVRGLVFKVFLEAVNMNVLLWVKFFIIWRLQNLASH